MSPESTRRLRAPWTALAGLSPRLVAVAAAPFLFLPWSVEVRESPRAHLLLLVALAALACAVMRFAWPRRALLPLGAFAGWLLVSSLVSAEPLRSLFGPFPHGDSALGWIAFAVLVTFPPPEAEMRGWAGTFVAVGAAQAILAAVQHFALGLSPSGTLGHPVFLGMFSAAAASVALGMQSDATSRAGRALGGGAFVFCAAAVAITGRRVPLAVLLLSGLAVGLATRRVRGRVLLVTAALAAMLAVGATATHTDARTVTAMQRWWGQAETLRGNLDGRLDALRVGLGALGRQPVFGAGFGAFPGIYAAGKTLTRPFFEARLHNLWAELALGAGLPGLLAFLWLLATWVRRARTRLQTSVGSPAHGTRVGCAAASAGALLFLLFNPDQPGLAIWIASLAGFLGGALPLRARAPLETRWRRALVGAAAALGLASLLPLGARLALGRGLAAETRGDPGAAVDAYRWAQRLGPTECRAEIRMSGLMRRTGDPVSVRRGLELLEACERAHPSASLITYYRGVALLEAHDRAGALEVLSWARAAAPSHPDTLRALARAQASSGRLEEALQSVDAAIRFEPHRGAAHNDRGNVLLGLGRLDEAIESYRMAVVFEREEPLYRRNLARARARRSSGVSR